MKPITPDEIQFMVKCASKFLYEREDRIYNPNSRCCRLCVSAETVHVWIVKDNGPFGQTYVWDFVVGRTVVPDFNESVFDCFCRVNKELISPLHLLLMAENKS